MADLFRPKIVEYTLNGKCRTPDGRRVTSKTPGATRAERQSKKWYGRVPGRKQPVSLSASKETARRMLNKLVGDAELARVGLVDPHGEDRMRPLAEHLEDFRRYLKAKGNTAAYVAQAVTRCQAVLDGCGFERTDDLRASAVVEFLATLAEPARPLIPLEPGKAEYTRAELAAVLGLNPRSVPRVLQVHSLQGTGKGKARRYSREVVGTLQERLCRGLGVTTSNHYLTAVKGFTRWLVKDGRMAANPLAHLSKQNAEVDVRRQRRALREDAFAIFVEAAGAGKAFRGLTGADRLVLYTLAANTGFRAGELASLSPASFDLDAGQSAVTVEAGYSKHRRKDVQPLRADVAQMMRQYLAGKPRHELLWPGTWQEDAAEMIRFDLQAAGIPYQDDAGRLFDFHAVRGQFISLLAANGVHPKVAQVLARHSTITLTMDYYTHLDVLDVAGALDKLPGLPGAQGAGAKEGKRRVS
jgi:integrase